MVATKLVHVGEVEVITFTVPTMTWLTITEYLCHRLS